MISTKKIEKYNEDYPNSYYSLTDIEIKKELIALHPEDLEIINLFNKRYKDNFDLFLQAWLSLKQLSTESIHFYNKKRMEKELKENLTKLCILDYPMSSYLEKEWSNFFITLFSICLDSSSYRNIALGVAKVSLKDTYMRLCFDIDTITSILPSKFQLEKNCIPFKNTALNTFFSYIEDAEEIWETYQSSK